MAHYTIQGFEYNSAKPPFGLNQDALCIDERRGIAMVADGISSSKNASWQAAPFCLHMLYQELLPLKETLINESEPTRMQLLEFLRDGVKKINQVMRCMEDIQLTEPTLQRPYEGWGTTLDAVLVHDHIAYIAHIGDGRIYLSRGQGALEQITEDHTHPSTDKLGLAHILNNRLSRVIPQTSKGPDMGAICLARGDALCLVSDGTIKKMDETMLNDIVLTHDPKGANEKWNRYMDSISPFASTVAGYLDISIETAQERLNDDATLIIVRRTE